VLELVPAVLPAPVAGWFTTRTGGVSAQPYASLNLGMHVEDEWRRVHANRELVARAAGLEDDALVFAQQVHGAGVAVVDRSSSRGRNGGVAGVDALVTACPGLGLVVLAADCLPVLLADAGAGVVAATHAGRQGLLAGVLEATLTAMQGLGATTAGTAAVIGPAACGGCYEVPQEMADDAERRLPGSRGTTRQGTPSVNLAAGARAVLQRAGVGAVTTVGGCTLEQPERWFSYRRDRTTGRHGGLVHL
jgi:YfiH family protein